ncbi:MAG: DUF1700 domain-containing protein [Clostridiales bacterium]|nr:DUF1700 domain-containing protein [Clostridiales bacterium]
MTKNEFLSLLQKQLKQREVEDIGDILQEYEEHFAFKLRDGYSEEEIAAKLGDPGEIAAQYAAASAPRRNNTGMKIIAGTGLAFVDIVTFPFLAALYAFSAVLSALAAASLTVAVSYIGGLNPYGILPPMPTLCALITAVTMLALMALSVLGVYFWTGLVTQLVKSYLRYRKNFMAAASGSTKLLPYPVRLKTPPQLWRTLRKIVLISLFAFVAGFVLTYAVCAISAGALEWWHAWNWFGGALN